MLLETRIWQALNVFAILVPAFVTLYAAFYTPNPFTQKQLQTTLSLNSDITDSLSKLGDRAKVSIMIDGNPVKNLFLSTIGLKNIGSVAIIPSDFYEPLSINVDGSWKILLVKDDLREEHPIWKRVNDHKFEAVPELLNPDDAISVSVYTTNIQNDHPQLAQLKPWWSTHILNLKSISVKNNQLNFSDELAQNPVNKLVPIVVFLYGPGLLSTSIGTIFFMVIYMRLLYQLKIITRARWSSIAAIVGVSIISVTSSESMTTYFFPDIFTRLTGVYNWLNMPWIILNLVVLMWLSWKALRAARGPGYSIARGESQP